MSGLIHVDCLCPLCRQRFSMSWTNEPCESTKLNPLSDAEFLAGQIKRKYRCPNCGTETVLAELRSVPHALEQALDVAKDDPTKCSRCYTPIAERGADGSQPAWFCHTCEAPLLSYSGSKYLESDPVPFGQNDLYALMRGEAVEWYMGEYYQSVRLNEPAVRAVHEMEKKLYTEA